MKRETLFTISTQSVDLVTLKSTLSEDNTRLFNKLCCFIRKQIGVLKTCLIHPYRVVNMNYIKTKFIGDKGEFNLQLILAGYTEFPTLEEETYRLYLSITDLTDAYWLIELLKYELNQGKALCAEN